LKKILKPSGEKLGDDSLLPSLNGDSCGLIQIPFSDFIWWMRFSLVPSARLVKKTSLPSGANVIPVSKAVSVETIPGAKTSGVIPGGSCPR
jgi:hypothetical protein